MNAPGEVKSLRLLHTIERGIGLYTDSAIDIGTIVDQHSRVL